MELVENTTVRKGMSGWSVGRVFKMALSGVVCMGRMGFGESCNKRAKAELTISFVLFSCSIKSAMACGPSSRLTVFSFVVKFKTETL